MADAAKDGDTVRIHYTGKFDDGTTFDSSEGRQPLEFEVGAGQIIPGLDKQVPGMTVGETSTVTIPPDEGYGPHDPERVQQVPRSAIPAEIEVEPGMRLEARGPDGSAVPLTVVGVEDDQVSVDANHPLAGKTLVFDVELVEIV